MFVIRGRGRCRDRSNAPVWLAAVLAASMLSAAAPAVAQEALLEQLQQGIEELQRGNLEAGLELIESVIAAEPRLAQAHYYAGMASAQMERWQQAYDYFVAASEQMPGYGDAHVQACRVAYTLGNYEAAYDHAVWASHAGVDMSGAFAGLVAVAEPPPDLQGRLQVPRVLIGPIDTEALLQRESPVFGGQQAEAGVPAADQRGAPPADPFAGLATTTATGAFPLGIGTTGAGRAAELQAEIHEVRRRFGEELVHSEAFGVVASLDVASHVLFLKVDDIGEGPPFPLTGFVKLFDAATEEEVYSRPLVLDDIGSVAGLRTEITRYIGYLETWLAEQRR